MRFAGIFASCGQFLSFGGWCFPGDRESGREKEELRNFREKMQIYLHIWKKSCIFAGESPGGALKSKVRAKVVKKTNQI